MKQSDYAPIKRRSASAGKSVLSHFNELKSLNSKPKKVKAEPKVDLKKPRKLVVVPLGSK